jgi:flagellar biosynthetic protein FlhB
MITAAENLLAIDLQWFADEDESRTEEPTEIKLQRLREEEGQVPKSQELISALGLLIPALAILFLAPSMLRTCVEMLRFFLLRAVEFDPSGDRLAAGLVFRYLLRLAAPVLASAVAAALFSNLIQTGFIFTAKPLAPDFNRILPRVGQFFTRTIFSAEGLFNLFKSVIKMVLIGSAAWFLIRSDIEKLVNLQKAGLWLGLTAVASLAAKMLIVSALLLLMLSIPDYMFQRWRFRKRNRMSRQEIKEERRQYESDPLIQDRIRRRMRTLMSQNIEVMVPQADVVITNPTHFAIALKYEQERMEAPQVSAKGADETALRIRRIAEGNKVPIVENKALARALFRETDVGDIIPRGLWEAVAKILDSVYQLNEERRRAEGMRA